MGPLKNIRRERFAHNMVSGSSLTAAYVAAIFVNRFKSRKKVETTLIAAPLSLMSTPKKQPKIETK
jgi:hypothetical protein